MNKAILSFIICVTLAFNAYGQMVELQNKSFEGIPKKGDEYAFLLDGWEDCGHLNFPYVTVPDIHPQNYWDVTLKPSEGNTYVGIVVRPDMSYESISQKLKSPLKANTCYAFSIDCAMSEFYKSAVAGDYSRKEYNFNTPAVLRIFGSKTSCYHREGSTMPEAELLAISPPISNINIWQSYIFTIEPSKDYEYITIEAFFNIEEGEPYKGHICIDNASNFLPISCDDDNALIASFIQNENDSSIPTKPQNKVQTKKKKEKPQIKKQVIEDDLIEKEEVVSLPKEKVFVPPTKPKQEKILSELSNDIVKGQKIRIENLLFEVDSINIPKDSYKVIDEIYSFLESNEKVSIEIGGHTNGLPPHSYCDKLSTERAKEVAEYLIGKGIKASRIKYKGYGKRQPIASNKTASGRSKNQRVEIKILTIQG